MTKKNFPIKSRNFHFVDKNRRFKKEKAALMISLFIIHASTIF